MKISSLMCQIASLDLWTNVRYKNCSAINWCNQPPPLNGGLDPSLNKSEKLQHITNITSNVLEKINLTSRDCGLWI